MNIVNIVLDLLSSRDTLGKVSSMLGIGQDQADHALKATVPSIFASLLGTVNRPGGATTLSSILSRDQGTFDERDISRYFTGSSSEGTGMLGSVVGDSQVNQISSVISRFTGLSEGVIGKLVGFIAPVILGVLGKYTRGLDASGITNFLMSQRHHIQSAMPSGLESMLTTAIPGLRSVFTEDTERTYATRTDEHRDETTRATDRERFGRTERYEEEPEPVGEHTGGSAWRWILPLALVALFLYFVPKMVRTDRDRPEPVAAVDRSTEMEGREIIVEGSDLLARSSDSVNAIRDEAGAEAAVPTVRSITERWEDLQVRFNKLPEATKKQVVEALRPQADDFRAASESAMGIPGVREKLKPVLEEQFRQIEKVVPLEQKDTRTW